MLHYPLGTRWLALDSRVVDLMIKAEGARGQKVDVGASTSG